MRILFIGDIVGAPGVSMVCKAVPMLVQREQIDLVVANAENASAGAGMSPGTYAKLRSAGIDVFTMGDHIYKRQDLCKTMANGAPICKPANFPPEAPGRNYVVAEAKNGTRAAVFSLMGRLYMRPANCPLEAADRILRELNGQTSCIVVDIHAEATGDKAVVGRYLDGRVSAVLGTHTHVPTADEQILPKGTAFISDVGMTGPYDSILGRRIDRVVGTAKTFIPSSFDVATGDPRLAGAIVDIDSSSGQATGISRVMVYERDLPTG